MTSLVNKSADWTPNYHKILIFFSTKSLKSLRAVRIDELADSNKPAIKVHCVKAVSDKETQVKIKGSSNSKSKGTLW